MGDTVFARDVVCNNFRSLPLPRNKNSDLNIARAQQEAEMLSVGMFVCKTKNMKLQGPAVQR